MARIVEPPDTCWECGWDASKDDSTYERLDNAIFECRRCGHLLDRT